MFKNATIKQASAISAEYHTPMAKRGGASFELSSSAMKEFARCPERWHDGYRSPESKSKDFGSLLDCLLLTPDDFEKRFIIQPEKYESKGMECPVCKSVTDSKKCKGCGVERVEVIISKDWSNQSATCEAWTLAQLKAGRVVVSSGLFGDAKTACSRMSRDEVIKGFIDESDKQVWLTGEWFDEATGITIPIKALLDLVPNLESEFAKCIGDLKSTRNASILAWTRQVFDMGYHIQAAFYFDFYKAAKPKEDRCNFCFLVQENFPPYQPAKRILSESFLELGRAEYRRALKNYAWCIKNSKWPGYDETDESVQGWTICEPTPWMEGAVTFAPKYQTEAPEAEPEERVDFLN